MHHKQAMKDVFIHLENFCVNTFVNLFRRDVDMVKIRLLLCSERAPFVISLKVWGYLIQRRLRAQEPCLLAAACQNMKKMAMLLCGSRTDSEKDSI
jgi:hypothetical protein